MANVWRIAILLLVTLAALPAVARAQEPRVSIAGGYVYLQQQAAGNLPSASYPFGWMATAGVRLGASRVSAVGEFGISWQANDFDERQQLMGVLGGASPQPAYINFQKRGSIPGAPIHDFVTMRIPLK